MTAKNELQKEVKPILALREALEARKGELAKALPRHLTAVKAHAGRGGSAPGGVVYSSHPGSLR